MLEALEQCARRIISFNLCFKDKHKQLFKKSSAKIKSLVPCNVTKKYFYGCIYTSSGKEGRLRQKNPWLPKNFRISDKSTRKRKFIYSFFIFFKHAKKGHPPSRKYIIYRKNTYFENVAFFCKKKYKIKSSRTLW